MKKRPTGIIRLKCDEGTIDKWVEKNWPAGKAMKFKSTGQPFGIYYYFYFYWGGFKRLQLSLWKFRIVLEYIG